MRWSFIPVVVGTRGHWDPWSWATLDSKLETLQLLGPVVTWAPLVSKVPVVNGLAGLLGPLVTTETHVT